MRATGNARRKAARLKRLPSAGDGDLRSIVCVEDLGIPCRVDLNWIKSLKGTRFSPIDPSHEAAWHRLHATTTAHHQLQSP